MQSIGERQRRSEAETVAEWRREQLSAAGFPLPLAIALAHDPRVDLHALIELVERGCEPRLAARILAPLDPLRPAA